MVECPLAVAAELRFPGVSVAVVLQVTVAVVAAVAAAELQLKFSIVKISKNRYQLLKK